MIDYIGPEPVSVEDVVDVCAILSYMPETTTTRRASTYTAVEVLSC